jgi:hypothetical protein
VRACDRLRKDIVAGQTASLAGCRDRRGRPTSLPTRSHARRGRRIGSGSDIPADQAQLEEVTGDEGRPLVVLEANNPEGTRRAMAFFVKQAAGDMPPVEGISKHFHVGVVFAHGWELGTYDGPQFEAGRRRRFECRPLLRAGMSWSACSHHIARRHSP